MADYLPHTPAEVDEMLDFLGMDSMEQLFAHIPAAVRLTQGLDLPDGMSEPDVAALFTRYTSANLAKAPEMTCFAGAGVYDHEVPAVVKMLAGRSEFVTAYTPYQPEVAQGVLQAIFEYQTLISRLSGLPIPNASLYDAATGLVEGLNMASGATGRQKMIISSGVHPHWREVARRSPVARAMSSSSRRSSTASPTGGASTRLALRRLSAPTRTTSGCSRT
jgi:glycine dehydrogenase subunit 1